MSWYKHLQFAVAVLIILLYSCKLEDISEIYKIPHSYRQLIASYNAGDSLKFKDGKGNTELYLVKEIDSSLVYSHNGIMRVRGWKDISVTCKERTNVRKGYEEYDMILLNKYADEDAATIDVRLKNFYTIDRSRPFVLRKDTVRANDIVFSNYYLFYSGNLKDQADPYAITEIYMTPGKGIIAYKTGVGNWWTRSN